MVLDRYEIQSRGGKGKREKKSGSLCVATVYNSQSRIRSQEVGCKTGEKKVLRSRD